MTLTHRSRKRRLRLVTVVTVVTVVAVVAAAIVYVVLQIPRYRTAFLVDTSATTLDAGADSDFSAVSDAVGLAAQNVGDSDALSLRRFGGTCGDPDNTAQIVDSGTGRAQQISDAVNTLTPGGEATLQSGILAAIDDFSGLYPFRGRKTNRIIVVTSHGTDACTPDQAALMKTIRDRVSAAGLQLDFRFVGYKVPTDQQNALTQVAAATGAPEPKFVQTAADLTTTLKQLIIPESLDAAPIQIPSTSISIEASRPPIPTEASQPPISTEASRPPIPTEASRLPISTEASQPPIPTDAPHAPPWAYIMGVWWKDGQKPISDSFAFSGKEASWLAGEAADPSARCKSIITDLNSSTQITMECRIGNNADELVIKDATVNLSVSGNILTIRGDPLLEGTYEDVDHTNPLRP